MIEKGHQGVKSQHSLLIKMRPKHNEAKGWKGRKNGRSTKCEDESYRVVGKYFVLMVNMTKKVKPVPMKTMLKKTMVMSRNGVTRAAPDHHSEWP